MSKNFYKIREGLEFLEPPAELFGKVMQRLGKEQRINVFKRRATIFGISTVLSALAFIPAFQAVQSRFAESGFIHFFSLLFSDFEIVTAYWQNFSLSLLEALPVMSLLIFLATALVFLESLKLLIRNIKIILSFQQKFN